MKTARTFFFFQSNKQNWSVVLNNFKAILDVLISGNIKNDFEIEIRKSSKKRSGQQLRSYWRLIRVLRGWMNNQGNNFTDEQVSDWVKIQAGHYQDIMGNKIPKSIADKSKATIDDMKKIIDFILQFGIDNQIEDCYIVEAEYDELLNFYRN